eukprot:gene1761-530_t
MQKLTSKAKNVVITGSTGMVGNIVLNNALINPDIKHITSITRRSVGIKHPKLTEVIHHNFKNFHPIEDVFENQDIAYFCLGVYTSDVSAEQLKEITVDYAISFADIVRHNSQKTSFNFLSGQGSDLKEKSFMPFARFKGMAENHLLSLEFEHLHIYRPGYIFPVEPKTNENTMLKVSRSVYPWFKKIFPNNQSISITSKELGRCMFHVGLKNDVDKKIMENRDMMQYLKRLE